MARGDTHPGGFLVHLRHLRQVGEIQPRIDAVGIEVERQGDEVDVAGPLPVAEQRPLHSLPAGQHSQFRLRDGAAAVVVGVQREDHLVPVAQVGVHILDLVGVDVRQRQRHGGGQVENDRQLRRRLPLLHHRVADGQRKVRLGPGKALRGVFQLNLPLHPARAVRDGAHPLQGDVDDLLAAFVEHLFALGGRGGVVQVDDGLFAPRQRLEGAADDRFPRGGDDLDGHIVGDEVVLDEGAHKLVLGVRCGGEAHLNLPKAQPAQKLEKAALFLQVHRHHQRLVAVAQIDAAPAGRLRDVFPLAPMVLLRGRRKVVACIFLNVFHLEHPFGEKYKRPSAPAIPETKGRHFRGTTLFRALS